MKILITGSEGQLAKEFLNLSTSNFYFEDKKTFDIANYDQMKSYLKNKKITHILNCAAFTDVENAQFSCEKALKINAPNNLIKLCAEKKIKLIFFSTNYIFDGKKLFYEENDFANPLNYYGYTKSVGEKLVIDNLYDYLIIRTSWLFGNSNNNFVKKILNASKHNKEIQVTTDEIASPTYCKDLAYFTLKLLNANSQGIYNITNNNFCSRYLWAKHIFDKLKINIKILKTTQKNTNSKVLRPITSVLSNKKIENELNIQLPDWKTAINYYLKEMI
jgi:dTDP-4-dehydrorhamnose reductase